MKIYTGSDHAGVRLRSTIIEHLRQQGHEVIDFGPLSEASTDYPDWAARVGRAVRGDLSARGLLVCGSGIGVGIAANKVHGVRAATPWNVESARLSREHNDANVLCVGARLIPDADALAIVDAWFGAQFEGERHVPRIAKIGTIERGEAALAAVTAEERLLETRRIVQRIWEKDPTAFTADAAHAPSIRNRLGWLEAPAKLEGAVPELLSFADEIKRGGFRHAVLLGMGGSSLCPEVLAHTFQKERRGVEVLVLDNTDPASVREIEVAIDFPRTLFVVASKSGSTIEVRSFEQYFWARALENHGGSVEKAGQQFVAITDPGTKLEARAKENRYRRTFVNAPDVGGRYSALTYFGLVPAALLGIDVARLLRRGREMADACRAPRVHENPGAALGAFLGSMARQGRDKMTMVISRDLARLGSWVEQLVAESTGKLGKGIVPIDCEVVTSPATYRDDRVFVVIQLAGATPAAPRDDLEALRTAGHPVFEIVLKDSYDIGGEFFRWEFATAVAGASLDVNPFDEPNVTEAKDATGKLLATYQAEKRLPPATTAVAPDDDAIRWHLESARPGDYIAFCAFFDRTDKRDEALRIARALCRDRLRIASTIGYGPRFLHSTGQLHKGGAPNGVFVQLTGGAGADLPVPGEPFTFGVLRDAQALGDLQVLEKHGLRALRIDLGADIEGGLDRLVQALAPLGSSK